MAGAGRRRLLPGAGPGLQDARTTSRRHPGGWRACALRAFALLVLACALVGSAPRMRATAGPHPATTSLRHDGEASGRRGPAGRRWRGPDLAAAGAEAAAARQPVAGRAEVLALLILAASCRSLAPLDAFILAWPPCSSAVAPSPQLVSARLIASPSSPPLAWPPRRSTGRGLMSALVGQTTPVALAPFAALAWSPRSCRWRRTKPRPTAGYVFASQSWAGLALADNAASGRPAGPDPPTMGGCLAA